MIGEPGETYLDAELRSRYFNPTIRRAAAHLVPLVGFKRERIDSWNQSLAKAGVDLHDGVNRRDVNGDPINNTYQPPGVIFATATSGIVFAFALKEFWKEAYPNEKPPLFMIINTEFVTSGLRTYQEIRKTEVKRLRQGGIRAGSFQHAAVFDEYKASGATLKASSECLVDAGFNNINFMHGQWGIKAGIHQEDKSVVRAPYIDRREVDYSKLIIRRSERSILLVNDMKIIGRLMAEEARSRGVILTEVVE